MSEDEEIAEAVRRHGWYAIGVGEGPEGEPPFSYTIGLCDTFGHPEIVVLGLDPKTAHGLHSELVAEIRSGKRYEPRHPHSINGLSVATLRVHQTQVITRLGYALGYYRHVGKPDLLEAVQVLWPDESGKLPTDLRCDAMVAHAQPRLDLAVPPSEFREFLERYRST
jgi:hypothetical protein